MTDPRDVANQEGRLPREGAPDVGDAGHLRRDVEGVDLIEDGLRAANVVSALAYGIRVSQEQIARVLSGQGLAGLNPLQREQK